MLPRPSRRRDGRLGWRLVSALATPGAPGLPAQTSARRRNARPHEGNGRAAPCSPRTLFRPAGPVCAAHQRPAQVTVQAPRCRRSGPRLGARDAARMGRRGRAFARPPLIGPEALAEIKERQARAREQRSRAAARKQHRMQLQAIKAYKAQQRPTAAAEAARRRRSGRQGGRKQQHLAHSMMLWLDGPL